MNGDRYDVTTVRLSDDGAVELSDPDLLELERTLRQPVAIAGGSDETCGGYTNTPTCANDLCGGVSDYLCANSIDCSNQTNANNCTNEANCNGSTNTGCTNGYASGCLGTNGGCQLKHQLR